MQNETEHHLLPTKLAKTKRLGKMHFCQAVGEQVYSVPSVGG